MSECLSDATLRAILDREAPELPHIAACAACRGRSERMLADMTDVAALLDALGTVPMAAPVRSRVHRFVVVPALAAAVLLLAILITGREAPKPEVEYFISLDDTGEPLQLGTVVPVTLPASVFDVTGTVPATQFVKAEVIVGDDGHARAFRILN